MGPRLLPLLRFACLLVATTSSVLAGAPGQQRQQPVPARLVLSPPDAVDVPAPATFTTATTRFVVRARRLGFSARRTVAVTARLTGRMGRLDVNLDRPIRSYLGIREVNLDVQVLDHQGTEVQTLHGSVPAGRSCFSLPLELPHPGRYTLVLTDEGLRAGKARMRVQPDGRASLVINAR